MNLLPTAYCLLPTAYCLRPTALFASEDRHLAQPVAIGAAAIHSGRVERKGGGAVGRGDDDAAVAAQGAHFGDDRVGGRLRALAEQPHPRADLVRDPGADEELARPGGRDRAGPVVGVVA